MEQLLTASPANHRGALMKLPSCNGCFLGRHMLCRGRPRTRCREPSDVHNAVRTSTLLAVCSLTLCRAYKQEAACKPPSRYSLVHAYTARSSCVAYGGLLHSTARHCARLSAQQRNHTQVNLQRSEDGQSHV